VVCYQETPRWPPCTCLERCQEDAVYTSLGAGGGGRLCCLAALMWLPFMSVCWGAAGCRPEAPMWLPFMCAGEQGGAARRPPGGCHRVKCGACKRWASTTRLP
jgi:hypothetical protein